MDKNVRRYLALRYAMALLLIFSVLLFTLIIFTQQLSTAESDARSINISGMQRMLSQRIGLLAAELKNAPTTQQANKYIKQLDLTTQLMAANHHELITNLDNAGKNNKLQQMYHQADGINSRVTRYLKLAAEVREQYKSSGITAVKSGVQIDALIMIAHSGLLGKLNAAVSEYEAQSKAKIEKFKQMELMIFAVGTIFLVLEALFIFRPTIKGIEVMTDKLRERNRALIEFSYRISHDLRSPIKSFSGLIAVAEDAQKANDRVTIESSFALMKKSIAKMEVLSEDIIKLTKMKMTNIPEERIVLGELLDSSIESLSFMEGFNDIELVKDVKVDGEFLVKRMYLNQIFENLISNAIKYRDQSAEQQRLLVNIIVQKDKCIVTFEDNGLGIPEQYHDKVFSMFQRFHPRHSFGSGLGLYLVEQNAKALGGDIKFQALDKGCKFTLTFPVRR